MLYIADKIPCSGHGSVDMPHLVGQVGSDPDTGSSLWWFVVFSYSPCHTHKCIHTHTLKLLRPILPSTLTVLIYFDMVVCIWTFLIYSCYLFIKIIFSKGLLLALDCSQYIKLWLVGLEFLGNKTLFDFIVMHCSVFLKLCG